MDFETWLGFLNVALFGSNGHTWGVATIERLRAFYKQTHPDAS